MCSVNRITSFFSAVQAASAGIEPIPPEHDQSKGEKNPEGNGRHWQEGSRHLRQKSQQFTRSGRGE